MSRWDKFLLFGLFSLLAACPASAQTFRVDVAGLGTAIGTTPQALLGGHSNGPLGSTLDASAVCDRGILLGKAACQNPISGLTTPQVGPAGGSATIVADDLIISGPAAPATINVTLHLFLDGSMSVDALGFYHSRLELSVIVAGQGGSGILSMGNPEFFSSGILAGFGPGSGARAINLNLSVPVNQPFSFTATLAATVGGTGDGTMVHNASSNFFDLGGLHFPISGQAATIIGPIDVNGSAAPVFTLPAGYTADSATLNIANNFWQGSLPTASKDRSWGYLKDLYR